KIAPFTLALLSDQARHITGQIFGVRNNEIYLFSQPRPVRTAHNSEGWTVASCVERAIPMLQGSFTPLELSRDVFPWDPV
ncbi:3-hydroxyacyl-CoA dehydrogenase, partial [Cupriavidus lacunae]